MTKRPFLPGYAVFAAMLAAAGLPIYIHAPKFYVDEYSVSLASLGTVLACLRLLDVVQDPALGWLSVRLRRRRRLSVLIGVAVTAAAMAGLFAVPPPVHPLLWFALTLAALFSGFSYLTICFYAQGVDTAARLSGNGHVRLAAWRETGALIGVSAAAVAPAGFMAAGFAPFTAFSAGFAVLALFGSVAMWREWRGGPGGAMPGLAQVLSDPAARRLLLIALVNATPVAITSTLFLFFVESRLDAPGWEGPLLLLFFLSAAASAPAWGHAANRLGTRRALLAGMVLAILSFAGAAFLGAGDAPLFAVVCVASGAAVGADMTLLPAIFARRMASVAPEAGQAFGLWSFVSKFSLAFAAVTLLPLLDAAGFRPGAGNEATALLSLTLLYAVVPCVLKLVAIALLLRAPLEDEEEDAATPEGRPEHV